jgi:hypothetical protein
MGRVAALEAWREHRLDDKRTSLRELLIPHAAELVAKVVELAKSGDTTALRICIDRLIPPIKTRDAPICMPSMAGSLADRGEAVLNALADERLTPDEATAIMQAIAAQARIVDVVEIEKRVEALEKRTGDHG